MKWTSVDDNATQFLYGLCLILIAASIGTVFLGNTMVLGAVVALLLLKDGVPNFAVGLYNLVKGEKP